MKCRLERSEITFPLQKGKGSDEKAPESQLARRVSIGKTHELREIDDRQAVNVDPLLPDFVLAAVEVHLAHGAGNRDGLGAGTAGGLEDLAAEIDDNARFRSGEGAAAAFGLVRPLHRFRPEGPEEAVHR